MAKQKHNDAEPTAGTANGGPGSRGWLMAATSCLLVAQVLLPADSTLAMTGAGIPLALLWIVLVVAWLMLCAWRNQAPLRWAPTDTAVLFLIVLHTISGGIATLSGIEGVSEAARPAINMSWNWIAMGSCFFLVRQLFTSERECRALLVVMVALASGLSAYGYYQSIVEIPETIAAYQRNPEGRIRDALDIGRYGDVDPLAQQQFEDRLFTQRPTATFSLTNSLAGCLTPWLVLAVGIAGCTARLQRSRWICLALFIVSCLIAGALYATHSRTALCASGLGVLLMVWGLLIGMPRSIKGKAVIGAALVLIVLVGAVALKTDNSVAAAADQSLQFRLEYWRATADLIAAEPWLGCGPGNFRDSYTAFKLPTALEEVADPHNFVFEVWATAGTPTMLAMVAVIVCFFFQVVRGFDSPVEDVEPSAAARATDMVMMLGAVLGVALAFILGSVYSSTLQVHPDLVAVGIVCFAMTLTIVALWRWIQDGPLNAALVAIAVAALLVNFCFAGGIGNPGVAISLWVLIAVGLNLSHETSAQRQPRPAITAMLVIAALALTLACLITAYNPVIRSATAIQAAETAERRGEEELMLTRIREAAAADPLSAEPWKQLSQLLFRHLQIQLLKNDPTATALRGDLQRDFANATSAWLTREPDSADARKVVGDMNLRMYRAGRRQDHLQAAIVAYSQAVARYPNSSILLAHLAWAYAVSGDREAAARFAIRAIALDEIQPHANQRLDSQYQRISDTEIGHRSARELMEMLRNQRSIDVLPPTAIE